jgi:hypothetical protein
MIGKAIKWVVSTALTPMAWALRLIINFVTNLVRILLFAGKIILNAIVYLAKPLEFIANIISAIVTGLTHLIRGTGEAVPEAAKGVVDARDAIAGAQEGVGMTKVQSAIPALRRPVITRPFEKIKHLELEKAKGADRKRIELHRRFEEDATGTLAPVPSVRPPIQRLTAAVQAQTQAVTRTSQGPAAQAPAINITIPVSVMMDGEEIGRAVVAVNDDEIRRQFGARHRRFSGVE